MVKGDALRVLSAVFTGWLLMFFVAQPTWAQEAPKTVPNIFTPNGDGINDVVRLESTESMLFVVYNRDGGEVFRAEGKLIIWDGLNQRGQRVADGIYYYLLNDPSTNGYADTKGILYLSTSINTQGGSREETAN